MTENESMLINHHNLFNEADITVNKLKNCIKEQEEKILKKNRKIKELEEYIIPIPFEKLKLSPEEFKNYALKEYHKKTKGE